MNEEKIIPLLEEELHIAKEPVKTGSVRVDKHVETRVERIEDDLLHERVNFERIPVGRIVSEIPQIRQQGEVTIIPVVEEEIVVTKRLVLKEEIHITRLRTVERFTQDVPVSRETATVERLDAGGRAIQPLAPTSIPAAAKRKSLLDP